MGRIPARDHALEATMLQDVLFTKLRRRSWRRQTALCWSLLYFLSCYALSLPQGTAVELEKMPSRSHYFDWINSQYEGTTEAQTLINMQHREILDSGLVAE